MCHSIAKLEMQGMKEKQDKIREVRNVGGYFTAGIYLLKLKGKTDGTNALLKETIKVKLASL